MPRNLVSSLNHLSLGYFMAHTKIRSSLLSLAVASTLGVAAPAFAQATSDHTFSGNIGIASSYIYRGLNQSDYKPAIQAGLDYSHASGFYIGTWVSSIKWLKDFGIADGNAEIDIYAGYKTTAGDIGLDFGVLRYEYTGSVASGATNPDTTEIYAAASYKWATLKYSHAVTNTFGTADSKNTYYIDFTATIPVMDNVSMIAHVGYQGFKGASKDFASYTDGKLAGVYDFGNGLTIEGGVTGTDADKSFYLPPGKKFTGKTTPYALLKFSKTF
jgi:uncharacterized protein (TIGR02001 family)